ncbi:MAG: hypothetical protein AB8B61_02200 [Cyclobacteriaceae bacterium]
MNRTNYSTTFTVKYYPQEERIVDRLFDVFANVVDEYSTFSYSIPKETCGYSLVTVRLYSTDFVFLDTLFENNTFIRVAQLVSNSLTIKPKYARNMVVTDLTSQKIYLN